MPRVGPGLRARPRGSAAYADSSCGSVPQWNAITALPISNLAAARCVPAAGAGTRLAGLRRAGDHLEQLGARAAALARKLHQLGDFAAQLTLGRCSDDADAPARPHLEQALVA